MMLITFIGYIAGEGSEERVVVSYLSGQLKPIYVHI